MARSERYKEPLAVLLIESVRGRLSPEREQRLFTSIKDGFRTTDLVAHLGNLRFVVLLPNSDVDQAQIVSERIRSTLGTDDVHVGMACYPVDGEDWSSLLRAAESVPTAA